MRLGLFTRTLVGIAVGVCFALVIGLAFWNGSTTALAADVAPVKPGAQSLPAAPPLKLEEKDASGLALTCLAVGGNPELADTRVSRLAALYVPAGSPVSPFVAAGAFTATFDGNLNMRLRDSFTFSAEGRGEVTVTVNNTPVFKAAGDDFSKAEAGAAVRLNKGKNKIRIEYKSPPAGDSAFRLLWTAKGETYADPVPATVLTHNAGEEAVAKGMRLREGRQLLTDLRCIKCHTSPQLPPASVLPGGQAAHSQAMPEVAMDAPSLADIGSRLNKDWMAAWINNPHALRPTAHMPRVFASANADKDAIDPRAADVAAYLATVGKPTNAPAPGGEEKIQKGGQLFTILHCIACHEQPGAAAAPAVPQEPAEPATEETPPVRIPLKLVRAKFRPDALAQFLLKPSAHYQWIGMPNFRFSKEEADAVAAFLLSEASGELPANIPAGDADKGKLALNQSGCLNCHDLGDSKQKPVEMPMAAIIGLPSIAKEGWMRGCLAADDAGRKSAPLFELNEGQRQAIVAFAATDRASLLSDAPAEFAARQVKAMNCIACHSRDGKESLLSTVYDAELKELEQKYPAPKGATAEAFAPDQRAPLMTWFGEKLRPEWATDFIAGRVAYKPRPYLHARMPGFETRSKLLALGLAAEHGIAPASPPMPKPDAEKSAIGSKLAGKVPNQAFNCVQCHAVAAQPAVSPFEAPAINFMHVSERLRPDYYYRWIHNPLKLDPTTKMPQFERDDGTTTVPVYEGDAKKQFEALWQYLLEGKAIKPPVE